MIEAEFDRDEQTPYFALKKIELKKMVLVLHSRWPGTKFTFKRSVSQGRPGLTIDCEVKKKIKVMKKCELGHQHEVTETIEYELGNVYLLWEDAEAMFEWFQQGTWNEIRKVQK